MKNFASYILLLLVLLTAAACRKTLCKDVDCVNGTCEYGTCICAAGFEIGPDGLCTDTIYCYNRDCGHGGCNEASKSCDCDPQYELDASGKCNALYRDHFIGSWHGTHITAAGDTVGPYTMTFSAGTADVNQVKIDNFCNFNCFSTGAGLEVVCNTQSATLLGFFTPVCAGISAIGGTINRIDDTRFSLSVTIFQSSTSTNCSGIFTKI